MAITTYVTQFNILEHVTYVGAFFALLFSGNLVPIPEEVLLLGIGYIISVGGFSFFKAGSVALFALIITDNIVFYLARNDYIFFRRFKEKAGATWIFRTRLLQTSDHVGWIIFALRFTIGLRMVSPFVAAIKHVSQIRFFLYDTLALILYIPLFMFLGYRFYDSILIVITRFDSVRHTTALIVLGLLWIIVFIYTKYMGKKHSELDT